MDATLMIHPQSTFLQIGLGVIAPSDQDGWRALGECIGSHENLQDLEFWDIDSTRENLEALITGMSQNRTVRALEFNGCFGEWPLGILAIFLRHNQNLSSLKVDNCCGGISSSLTTALRGCTSRSLQHIACIGFEMGDDAIAEFIEALAGLHQLTKLKLDRCDIGRRGCGAVAALLQSPACVLQDISLDDSSIDDQSLAVLEPLVAASSTLTELSLCGMDCSTTALQSFSGVLRSPTCMLKTLYLFENAFGDVEMISFSDALATNHRLERLGLDNDCTITGIGFAAMTRALCNTSSISDVHSSNHMLRYLGLNEIPYDLLKYLYMNKKENKCLVAREKIFMHFFQGDFSMEPFHENNMPSNILPHLLSWIGRMPDGESFTALFNFLRRMPPVWGNRRPVLRRSRRKRKVRN